MDAEQRELFAAAVARATAEHSGAALDAALADIGWREAAAADEAFAVRVLFEQQGLTLARSSALDWIAGTTTRLDVRAGMDPDFGVVAVAVAVDGAPSPLGRRALAHELIGAARAMLELARGHALAREQFGRPIAAFQAVRHRLAETLVAIESAQAALDAAWIDGSPVAAAMAKAAAGRAGMVAAKHCQQVLAGIGFTAEHLLHRYIRRVLTLDHLLGDHVTLTRELGENILRDRAAPAKLPL